MRIFTGAPRGWGCTTVLRYLVESMLVLSMDLAALHRDLRHGSFARLDSFGTV